MLILHKINAAYKLWFLPTWREETPYYRHRWIWWPVEMVVRLLEILFIPEAAMFTYILFRKGIQLKQSDHWPEVIHFYGNIPQFNQVMLHPKALFSKHFNYAYVSFDWINFWGNIDAPTLMHELAHVIQYRAIGSVYIPRALHAQHFGDGYSYGGLQGLQQWVKNGAPSHYFNLEQEASIIEHYYILRLAANTTQIDKKTSYILDGRTDLAQATKLYKQYFNTFLKKYQIPQN